MTSPSSPAISVLMTAYNREAYIEAAIESVLAQTFADFELVIVDDCSTDATREIASRYLGDPRVRLHVNQRNLGDYPNRNHAATLARGEFLKYHDSDDLMYPHCLEIMAAALRAYPQAALAMSAGSGWPGGPSPMLLTPRMAYQREYLGSGLFREGPASALLRADAFEQLGRFPLEGVQSDPLFWMHACAKRSIVLTQADLFYYRVHDGQELRKGRGAFELAKLEGRLYRALDSPDCPLDDGERDQARRNLTWGFLKRTLRDLRQGNPALALFRLRNTTLSPGEWMRYARRQRREHGAGTPLPDVGEQR